MAGILKKIYKILNIDGTSWDKVHFETDSAQVIHKKADGSETTAETEINQIREKVGDTNVPGYFPTYKTEGHNIGFTFLNLGDSTVVRSVIDDRGIDLIPNNKAETGNYKIVDMAPVIVDGAWRMNFKIYVDGRIYEKYVDLK